MAPRKQAMVRKVALKERTFCQIAGKDISEETCSSTQGQDGCFGCASPYRMCEACHDRLVDVPAVGMCSMCLILALNGEELSEPIRYPSRLKVRCQVHGNRAIQAPMCKATQGQEGCRNCSAVTRLCERCQKSAIRIVRYGMCLKCSVDEYGDGWNPHDIVFPKYEPPPLRRSVTVTVPREKRGSSVRNESPALGLVSPSPPTSLQVRDPLFHLAVRHVTKKQEASQVFLQRALHIGVIRAERILSQLEDARVVSSVPAPRKPRMVLVPFDDELTDSFSLGNEFRPKARKASEGRRAHSWRKEGESSFRRNASSAGRMARKLVPEVKQEILRSGDPTERHLKSAFQISFATARQVLLLLEEEGFLGPPTHGAPRKILALTETGGHPPVKLRAMRSLKRVERLIQVVGKNSELGRTLQALMEEVVELRQRFELFRSLSKRK